MHPFNVNVEIARQEDGLWRARVPDLQGCWVDAPTIQQAIDEIQEGAAMIIDFLEERGEALPASVTRTTDAEFKASLPLDIHAHHFKRIEPRASRSTGSATR